MAASFSLIRLVLGTINFFLLISVDNEAYAGLPADEKTILQNDKAVLQY